MTSTATQPDATQPAKPPPRSPVTVFVGGAVFAVLLIAVLWSLWFVIGLLWASHTVQSQAAVAQSELQRFRVSLQAGDEVQAKAHLTAGRAALADADAAAGSAQVRTAKGLPFVGSTIDDLDHLLAAAGILTRSAGDALAVYENFSGDDSKLFSKGTLSIPAIEQAQTSVDTIKASLVEATQELRQVQGEGYKGETALAKKRSAMRQVASLQAEIVSLGPLLDNMPAAVGAYDPKTYLVAVMNPAEMRASGGAPLSVAFLRFDNGRMSVTKQGATSALTGVNRTFRWNRLAGRKDPFQPPAGTPQRFVNTNANPSFVTSGEQMVRATKANFGIRTDGVIALDITAIGHLLDATGPIETEFYGTLTGANIAKKLVVRAYVAAGDDAAVAVRHDVNDQLMAVMLSRLTEGGGLIGKAQALGEAVPGRHLQLWFRDAALQRVVEDKDLAGAVPVRDTGNLTAVYTQNGNASKMDVFQQRTVRETVHLRRDGSARVRRTVAMTNDSPPFRGVVSPVDLRVGYETRWATDLVINLMPPGARLTKQPRVELAATVDDGVDQDGHTYAQAAIVLPPDSSGSLTWEYVVPRAAVVKGNRMYFRDYVAPQSVLNVPTLDLRVRAPHGWVAAAGGPWTTDDRGVRTSTPMDRLQVVKLTLRRAAGG